jgi:hypothetical protein
VADPDLLASAVAGTDAHRVLLIPIRRHGGSRYAAGADTDARGLKIQTDATSVLCIIPRLQAT